MSALTAAGPLRLVHPVVAADTGTGLCQPARQHGVQGPVPRLELGTGAKP